MLTRRSDGLDSNNMTFPAHLLIAKIEANPGFNSRKKPLRGQQRPQAGRVGAAAAAGSRANRRDQEWVMTVVEQQRVEGIRTLIDAGEYAQAEENALDEGDDDDFDDFDDEYE